jgi:Flp pilus assembly protein TadB
VNRLTAVARMWAAVLAAALLGLLALAPASAQAEERPRIVVMLLDTNVSPWKNQMAQERHAAETYVRALPSDVEVGLVVFNDHWQTALAPTASRSQLFSALDAAQPAGVTSNALAGAITGAVRMVRKLGAFSRSRLLVLTNGEFMTQPKQTVRLPVDAITWHIDSDDYVSVIQKVAATTGGHATTPGKASGLVKDLPPKPQPARPAHPVQLPRWQLTQTLISVLACVFVVLFVLALLVLRSLRRRERRPELAGQIERYGPRGESGAGSTPQGEGALATRAVDLMSRALKVRGAEPKLALRLDRAGITRAPAEWALLGVCLSAGLAAALTIILGNFLIGLLVAVAVGWAVMHLILSFKITKRCAAFDEQLPNVLQLVAGSLQTGFSLAQALDGVVREGSQPAAGEFARALTETRLGVDVTDALDSVADRLESSDLRWVIMAIRIQRETGGNLAEVLRNTVATMRERGYLRRQVRTLSAEGRLSAYILLGLPVLVGGWLFYSNPTYMHPLVSTFFGLAMLSIAGVLFVLGSIWMRNLIKIKV